VKLLQCIETGGPGGAETVFATLSDELRARGHEVVCVVGAGSWLPGELQRRGLEAHVLESDGALDLGLLQRLRRVIRERHIDVVHAHLFEGAVYAALAARLEGVPCIVTLHGQVDVARSGWRSAVKRRFIALCVARVVTVSDALRHDLQALLPVPRQRFRVIHNGVTRPGPLLSAPVAGIASDGAPGTPRLLTIGNIRASKDYPTLLAAVARLRDRYPSVHLDIAGEPDQGGLYEALQAQLERQQLQCHVTFHGFVADPGPLLSAADCFVLASSQEGFSLVTIEAMLASVPVVATRSGGPEEILQHEVTGLLVPVRDPEAIANAVERIIASPELAERLRHHARADAQRRFSIEAMLDAYEALYREVCPTG
jgi:glycosyltransferase involved in cell wall biosynthesis